MNSISDYKGLILITFIIIAVLYFSPDLECMLLFSGILVNIVTLCLNTGSLKIPTNGSKDDDKEKFESSPSPSPSSPNFGQLCNKDLEKEIPEFPTIREPDFIKERAEKSTTAIKTEYSKFPEVAKYKGAVDYEDDSEPAQVATDRIPLVGSAHQGINSRRQFSGAYNRRSVIYPIVAQELSTEESKRWWEAYDEVTTIDSKDAPY